MCRKHIFLKRKTILRTFSYSTNLYIFRSHKVQSINGTNFHHLIRQRFYFKKYANQIVIIPEIKNSERLITEVLLSSDKQFNFKNYIIHIWGQERKHLAHLEIKLLSKLCFETGVIHSHNWFKTTGTKKGKAHYYFLKLIKTSGKRKQVFSSDG